MNAIQNITIGQPDRLKKPVGYTILSNLVNIIPFCLSIEAIDVIFRAFDGNGTPLDTTRLWTISGILVIYVAVMVAAERASYRANFREAYAMTDASLWQNTCANYHSDFYLAVIRATCPR